MQVRTCVLPLVISLMSATIHFEKFGRINEPGRLSKSICSLFKQFVYKELVEDNGLVG